MSDIPSPPGPPPGPPPSSPPPGPPPYAPPPGGPPPPGGLPPGGAPRGPARVDINRWLKEAWALIQPAWLEIILVVLVLQILVGIGFALCILPGLLVMGPLTGGLFVHMAKRMTGRPAEVGDLFLGFRRFGPTTVLALALFLIPAIAFALLYVPTILASAGMDRYGGDGGLAGAMGCLSGLLAMIFIVVYPIVAGTFLVFAFPLVMFRGRGAADAIRESVDAVKPQMTGFLMLLLAEAVLLAVASSVGSVLCGIGVLVTSPLAYGMVVAMQLGAFRDFFGLTENDLAEYRA